MEHDPKTKRPDEDSDPAGQAISESKMREALGIGAQPPERQVSERHMQDRHSVVTHGSVAPRRRFVVDGDIPVVMIGRGRRDHGGSERPDQGAGLADRITALETALTAERDARTRAETLLAEARHAIQQLQTQAAHADLARDEALTHARRAAHERTEAISERDEAMEELLDAKRTLASGPPTLAPIPPAASPPLPTAAASAPTPPASAGKPRRTAASAIVQPDCDVPAFTAQIMAAYLSRNQLSLTELPGLAESVVQALIAPAAQPVRVDTSRAQRPGRARITAPPGRRSAH